MRPAITSTSGDPLIAKNFASIRETLNGQISLDNFNMFTIGGTTSKTADAETKFQHSMSPQPVGWLPLVGDVYVQAITNKYIDVRSRRAEVPFKIVLLGGSPPVAGNVPTATTTTTPTSVPEPPPEEEPETIDLTHSLQIYTPEIQFSRTAPTQIKQIKADANYLYYTCNDTTYLNHVNRIDLVTGVHTSIALTPTGTNGLSAMRIQGNDLWVTSDYSTGSGLNSCKVFRIDLPSFTLQETITCATSANVYASGEPTAFTDIYVDTSAIFLLSRTTLDAKTAIFKNDRTTGANIAYASWLSGSNRQRTINFEPISNTSDTYLVFSSYKVSGGSQISFIGLKTSFNSTFEFDTPNASFVRYNYTLGSYLGGRIYVDLPLIYSTAFDNSTNVPNMESLVVVVFDINATTFTLVPMTTALQPEVATTNSISVSNGVISNGRLYIPVAARDVATEVKVISIPDGTDTSVVTAFGHVAEGVSVSNNSNDMICLDSTGVPLIFRRDGTLTSCRALVRYALEV